MDGAREMTMRGPSISTPATRSRGVEREMTREPNREVDSLRASAHCRCGLSVRRSGWPGDAVQGAAKASADDALAPAAELGGLAGSGDPDVVRVGDLQAADGDYACSGLRRNLRLTFCRFLSVAAWRRCRASARRCDSSAGQCAGRRHGRSAEAAAEPRAGAEEFRSRLREFLRTRVNQACIARGPGRSGPDACRAGPPSFRAWCSSWPSWAEPST